MINRGENPIAGFTKVLNHSVKEWMNDAPNAEHPFEFLVAGMEGTIDMCNQMKVNPGNISEFPRMVKRVKSMAEARGFIVEIDTNIPEFQS